MKKNEKTILSQSIHISVDLKNTVGAGDAMVGAFIGELLYGRGVSEAHLRAAHRADMVCKDEKRRSMPDIPGHDFFFSYSKKDNEIVEWFYEKFTNYNKYTVFKDIPEIKPGSNLGNTIGEAIDNSQVFVYFSSENANKSPNVIWEIKKATKTKKNRIIIIKLDDSPYPEEVRKDIEHLFYLRFDYYKYKETKFLKLDKKRNLDYDYKKIIDFYNNRPI